MPDAIEFYDIKYKKKIMIPKEQCVLEILETSKGPRRRIVATIWDNPNGIKRRLSKFCSKDFKL